MIIDWTEEIFAGYSGAASYGIVILLLSAVGVYLRFARGRGRIGWQSAAGLALIILSRLTFMHSYFSGSWKVLSFLGGQAGLYIVLLSLAGSLRGSRMPICDRDMLAGGVISASSITALYIWFSSARIGPESVLLMVGTFVAVGIWFGFLTRIIRAGSGAVVAGAAAALLCLSGMIAGMVLAGVV
ncbi:MAG: hypothetical protein GF417_04605, partial [Candidatus Latescibacteria bacterium]|nr:hypothetical protein [bacterium]MBD3423703.1 hypothetical protein [Candidatus Latescibacterota bacterium]